jgi:hypothetical protein
VVLTAGQSISYSAHVDAVLDTWLGLPVHVLVVHAVVVLVPLAAIGALIMVFRPAFSRRFGVIVVIVAVVGLIGSILARFSGEQLAGRVGFPDPHSELGAVLPAIVGVFTVVTLVFWLFDRGVPGNRARPAWLKVMAALVAIVAIAAVVWTIRVGHSGTEATWKSVIDNTRPGQVTPP